MSIPPALKNRDQRDNDQWQRDKGEQDVRDEDRKINPRDQSTVAGRFFADVRMISNVADEKSGRSNERDDHARDVSLPDIAPDPKPAHRDEHGANCVQ